MLSNTLSSSGTRRQTGRRTRRRGPRAVAAIGLLLTLASCYVPDGTDATTPALQPTVRSTGTYNGGQQYVLIKPGRSIRRDSANLIVYVHGGAWVSGSAQDTDPLFENIARMGNVVVSVSYPLNVPVEEQVQAVKTAVVWATGQAARWGVNPDRLFLGGNSAGAHLATMAALTWTDSRPLRGVIAVSTPFDLRTAALASSVMGIPVQSAIAQANRCASGQCTEDRLAAISPQVILSSVSNMGAVPAFYIVTGDADTVVPAAQSRAFAETIEVRGGDRLKAWVDIVEGGDHGPSSGANLEYVGLFLVTKGG